MRYVIFAAMLELQASLESRRTEIKNSDLNISPSSLSLQSPFPESHTHISYITIRIPVWNKYFSYPDGTKSCMVPKKKNANVHH